MALNPKQERFCLEYTVDFNGTQAAIRAGYSAKTANEQAGRLLVNVSVLELIQKLKQKDAVKAEIKLDITKERVLRQLANISFSDIRAYYNKDGSLKSVHELDDDAAAAMAGMDIEEIWETRGGGGPRAQIGITKKIKRWDSIKAMAEINKMLGFYAPEESKVTLQNESDLFIGGKKVPND